MPSGVYDRSRMRDVIGRQFGRLRVLALDEIASDGHQMVSAACDCGTVLTVRISQLRRTGKPTRSCGCLQADGAKTEPFRRLYRAWLNMRQRVRRCPSYVSRSIGIEASWDSFAHFFRDMASAYHPGAHLHRINPLDHYGPSNCEWLSPHEHRERHRAIQAAKAS